ncbi:MAG: AraC family transcriptional regulator [Pseudomonadota bacterium]
MRGPLISQAEVIDRDMPVQQTVLGDGRGRHLRARRLLQRQSDGVSPTLIGTDHLLVYQLGGGAGVERYYDGVASGVVDRLRTVTLAPALRPSQWRMPEEVDILHIYLDHTRLSALAEAEGHDPARAEVIDAIGVPDRFLDRLAPALLHEIARPGPAFALMVDAFESVIAHHLLRAYSTVGAQQVRLDAKAAGHNEAAAVARVQTLLMDRMEDPPAFDALAAEVGLPPSVLRVQFKREVGMAPHAWLTMQRLAEARRLLAESREPIAAIAYACGFSSQSHMTALFSEHIGMPPGRYRKEATR